MSEIYFLVSLPRTGTKSICSMAETCGLKPRHVLSENSTIEQDINLGYNLFADSPFYVPNFLHGVITSSPHKIKFIYANKDNPLWIKSFKQMLKDWRSSPRKIDDYNYNLNDRLSYEYLMNNIHTRFHNHKVAVFELAQKYNIEILDYDFKDGWKPLCDFIDKPVPNTPIPHIKSYK